MKSLRNAKAPAPSIFVPWEPYKAAPGPDHCDTRSPPPISNRKLIPYRSLPVSKPDSDKTIQHSESRNGNIEIESKKTSSGIVNRKLSGISCDDSEKCVQSEIEKLKDELQVEREVSAELKRLLVASMGDDVVCHLQSLSEDKVRLAHTLESFGAQLTSDRNRADDLQITSDMWKCKFLAMSIRADEILTQKAQLLSHLRNMQTTLGDIVAEVSSGSYSVLSSELRERAMALINMDLSELCGRTPCDEKFHKPDPLTANITVSCCRNCSGNEIKLI
ncbi:hypothetical protein AB6A40_002063 [Gnathostoma spinigerum]|uniref:Golgin-45 n=1 Tax=Gnathostoma spinigerum TaxID=75299 RepID=A0ABD6EB42_9BILA